MFLIPRQNGKTAATKAVIKMRMLEKLRDKLEIIEKRNDWEFNFVEGLVIEMEEGRDFKANPLSKGQFAKLVELSYKYDDVY